jgi:hypothetical protein
LKWFIAEGRDGYDMVRDGIIKYDLDYENGKSL